MIRVHYKYEDRRLVENQYKLIEFQGTGEVLWFIKGNIPYKDQFVIADDVTKKFIKVDMDCCTKID